MRTQSKKDLEQRNAELSAERDCQAIAIGALLADEITWLRRGSVLLGLCGETRACGGVVVVRFYDESKKRFEYSGAYYFEAWYARVLQSTSDHTEARNLRTAANSARAHVQRVQAEFYAPRVAESLSLQPAN